LHEPHPPCHAQTHGNPAAPWFDAEPLGQVPIVKDVLQFYRKFTEDRRKAAMHKRGEVRQGVLLNLTAVPFDFALETL